MDLGKVEYMAGGRSLNLTLVEQEDFNILKSDGLAGLRRKRLLRLATEAVSQGAMLGYEDLCCLLVSSVSTLKRDVAVIEDAGVSVLLKGRRRRALPTSDKVAAGV